MAFEKISENLHRLNENIRSFAQSSAEYYKLDLFNKTMKGATAAVKGVAVAFFMIFALLFLSIALSILISKWIAEPSSGFFVIGGLYLLVGLAIIFYGSPIINRIMLSKASKKFFDQADESDDLREEDSVPKYGEDEITIDDERV